IIKRAMIRIPKALADAGLTDDAKMLLQVHDELVFEAKQGSEDAVIQCVKDTMQNAANPVLNLSVPLVVEAGTGANWAEAH
ncbi:MAG TPA: hypothetical protein DCG04_16680, partial [Rhodospirillaceae bacterium]|nr:hypothetical protein [Rhodospirillaceae bacterium]